MTRGKGDRAWGSEVPTLPRIGLGIFCPLIGPCGERLWDLRGGVRRTHRAGMVGSTHQRLVSERLQELTTHLRSVFDFREGVRKRLQGKHISGVWAQGTPPKSNTSPISYLLTHSPGKDGSCCPFDLGRAKLLNCIIKYCLFSDDS